MPASPTLNALSNTSAAAAFEEPPGGIDALIIMQDDVMDGVAWNDTPAIRAWCKAQDPGTVGIANPFRSLLPSVQDDTMELESRPDAPAATICGPQVAGDEFSIRWAIQNGISVSVPLKYSPHAKIIAGQVLSGQNLAL